MAKKICVIFILFNLTIVLYAQSSPGNRGREWNEEDGYAIVNG